MEFLTENKKIRSRNDGYPDEIWILNPVRA